MVIDILIFIFIVSFIAIVALGHALLVAALWPAPPEVPGEARRDTAASLDRRLMT
jgi:hypothetical protein